MVRRRGKHGRFLADMGHVDRRNEHARKRAKEHHGIDLTPEVEREIITTLERGEGLFITRTTGRRAQYEVIFRGKPLRVVIALPAKVLVTILPDQARRAPPDLAVPGASDEVEGLRVRLAQETRIAMQAKGLAEGSRMRAEKAAAEAREQLAESRARTNVLYMGAWLSVRGKWWRRRRHRRELRRLLDQDE